MHDCPRCQCTCDCDQSDCWDAAASESCLCDCEYYEQDYLCGRDDDVLAALDDDYVRRSPSWIKDIVIYSLAYNFRAWRNGINEPDTFAIDRFWLNLSPYYQISNGWSAPWADDHPF